MIIGASVVRFRRVQDSPNEWGIAALVEGNVWTITDKQGVVVPAPVWDYVLVQEKGCFTASLVDTA
jgi:hypothetical protein